MSEMLHPHVSIVACETVRDVDGLALSSRNVRLNTSDREAAAVISRALKSAQGESELSTKLQSLRDILSTEKRFALDYAEIVDGETFEIASETTIDQRAIVAGWINGVRLIDTMSMNSSRVNVLVSP